MRATDQRKGIRVSIAATLIPTEMRRSGRASKNLLVLLLIGAMIGANLIFVTAGHAQEVDGEPQLGEYAGGYDQDKIREDMQREYARAVQELSDEREAEMRASWDAFEETRNSIISSYLSAMPRPPIVGSRFSTNAFGATYKVPNGSYSGDALVGLVEVTRQDDPAVGPFPIARGILRGQPGLRHFAGGWNFEPGGMLKETYSLVSASVAQTSPGFVTQCKVVDRMQYVKPNGGAGMEFLTKGVEQTCDYSLVNKQHDACVASAPSQRNASRPTEYWSTNGQVLLDFSNTNAPVLLYPDGSSEIVKAKGSSAYIPFNEGLLDSVGNTVLINGLWFTHKKFTRKEYTTSYTYDSNTGWLQSVTDPKGRNTQYTRDPNSGRVTGITAPGPGGGTLQWQMTWDTLTWNPAATFPDIQCLAGANNPVPCSNSLSYTTLTSLQIPDGRRYVFTYGPTNNPGWGNLDTVTTPDGAVTDFDYRNANTQWITALRLRVLPRSSDNLDNRHMSANTVYPQGTGRPGFTTHIDFDQTETLTTDAAVMCGQLNWIKRTYHNGDGMREAQCATGSIDLFGRTFAQEVWQGSQRLQATYYGNIGHIGDFSTPRGDMYIDYEQSNQLGSPGVDLDVRPTKVIHNKDGVQWMEQFDYELSNIPVTPRCSGCSSFRTTGNLVNSQILDGAGNLLARTITTYFHNTHSNYLNRNLLRLPETVRFKDSTGATLSRTEYNYDEFPLAASGAQNLDPIGVRRGTETTITQYKDAQNGGGPISSHKQYFDTGDVQQTTDPKGNPKTMTYDFGLCLPSHQMLTSTIRNAKNHLVTTVADCNTGLTLRATDPNNQSAYTQYDTLGRVVETAGPGDTLTPVPGFTRDPNAPLNGGSAVGNNGQGPTTWFEYLSLGIIDQPRVLAHTKDGTTNGSYAKALIDGLGRTIQTRSEVDPNTSSGNGEIVVTTEYDSLGRVSKNYVPIFGPARDSFDTPLTGALFTITGYDALGRVTSVQQPGLPVVRTDYGGSGSQFSSTLTDAKGNQTIIYTDILGHKVRVQQQSPNCTDPMAPGWCVTQMDYDAAGRLLTITDPSWNHTTFVYDSLGRKKQMTDPDMGTWDYDYDDNGSLIYQRDAKGQIILMVYDVLNRITRKDLPPNDPVNAAEDTTYFYDGEGPAP